MDIQNIETAIPSLSTEKSYTYPYNPDFFILSAKKSFETLLKHNGSAFVSESFL